MRDSVDEALWLLPVYLGDAAVRDALFAFFLRAFDVLRAQMGAEAVERALHTLFAVVDQGRDGWKGVNAARVEESVLLRNKGPMALNMRTFNLVSCLA